MNINTRDLLNQQVLTLQNMRARSFVRMLFFILIALSAFAAACLVAAKYERENFGISVEILSARHIYDGLTASDCNAKFFLIGGFISMVVGAIFFVKVFMDSDELAYLRNEEIEKAAQS